MRQFKRKSLLVLSVFFVSLAFLLFNADFLRKSRHNTIAIGGKNCTEQHILGEMLSQLIEARTDLKVERRFNLEGTILCFNGLISGDIDVYTEYTGTGFVHLLKEPPLENAEESMRYLRDEFLSRYDLKWLDPFGFNNTYTLIVDTDFAEQNNVKSISALIRYMQNNPCVVAIDPEFSSRPEWAALKVAYAMPNSLQPMIMDQALLYFTLHRSKVDVISGFSTDSNLHSPRFFLLEDDRHSFPPYAAAPLVRSDTLERFPPLSEVLNLLHAKISDAEMRRMNHAVEQQGRRVEIVSREFLQKKSLLL